MNNADLENMIRSIVRELSQKSSSLKNEPSCSEWDVDAPDISTVDLRTHLNVTNPLNREGYMELKQVTPARLGVWRAGPRQRTNTLLRFQADHAVAMDAVFTDVPEDFLQDLQLFSVKTTSRDKAEFLANPATGRVFDEENTELIKQKCIKNPQVQIIVADGLSSTSIVSNIKDALPALMQGLKGNGLSVGTPFFIKNGRVGSMDSVTEIVNSEVTVLFIGERPGLVTGESMSCYMSYKGFVGMPEAMRSVVSNIYRQGTAPAEAGAHIADIVKKMIDHKASGLDLKL